MLMEDPASFISRSDGSAAIVLSNHHSHLGVRHHVGAGVPPPDRKAVFDRVLEVLAPHGFEPTEPSYRIPLKIARSSPLTKAFKELPATLRQEALSRASGGEVTFEILAQSTTTEMALRKEIRNALGFSAQSKKQGHDEVYKTTGLTVKVLARPLGSLGSVLSTGDGSSLRTAEERRRALRERAETVAQEMECIDKGRWLTLVELQNYAGSIHDPKEAIRWGLAMTRRLSQFITPFEPDEWPEDEGHEAGEHQRARSAVRDALRQIGYLPGTPLDVFHGTNTVPQNLQMLGLWVVTLDRRASSKQYLPIVVRLEGGSQTVRSTYPGATGWLPYAEALLEVANRQLDLGLPADRFPAFLDQILEDSTNAGATLLMCHAQNARQIWPWLTNQNISTEGLTWGRGPQKPIKPRELRVARVRDSTRDEVPQWYAFGNGEMRLPSGLFKQRERVYLSLQGKTAAMKSGRTIAKLDHPNLTIAVRRIIELFLPILQDGDEADQWAMVVHRLRQMAGHHDEATQLPLPLHLARGLTEYVAVRRND
jgi:hypothetical protein